MLKLIKYLFGAIVALVMGIVLVIVLLMDGNAAAGVPQEVEGIPPVLLDAYAQAAANTERVRPGCANMRWSILAGIGKVESNHLQDLGSDIKPDGDIDPPLYGPQLNGEEFAAIPDTDNGELDNDTEWDRAVGPMQFIPDSWARFGQDGNGDGKKDPQNVFDATLATAAHLCGSAKRDFSDREQVKAAVHAYNPGGGSSPDDNQYVADVMEALDRYDALHQVPADFDGDTHPSAATAISWAKQQLGTPYVYGGTCTDAQMTPTQGNCDCSSLAQIAYQQAGISLNRTTTAQYFGQADQFRTFPGTKPLTNGQLARLMPGDLLYFDTGGAGGDPSHMGIYLGGTRMLHAPRTGKDVEIIELFDGYYDVRYRGALRPWEPA
ncbi:C40 family peptidase [Nocardiopsis halophila]|uniref:C40 family peptidase n=1 Tax=Nocardiopsis halophila TaxID=141692 RepID=UPI00034BE940|nr:NlpC/P60 family protein [Nocardiopsis halophila]